MIVIGQSDLKGNKLKSEKKKLRTGLRTDDIKRPADKNVIIVSKLHFGPGLFDLESSKVEFFLWIDFGDLRHAKGCLLCATIEYGCFLAAPSSQFLPL